jgi:hypothetical protein
MIDREKPKRAENARRKPQMATADGLLDCSGRSEACLIQRSDALSAFGSRQLGNPGLEPSGLLERYGLSNHFQRMHVVPGRPRSSRTELTFVNAQSTF